MTTTSARGGGSEGFSSGCPALPISPENSRCRFFPRLREFQQDAGRAENMSGVDKDGADVFCQLDRLPVEGGATECIETVERIEHRVERQAGILHLLLARGAPGAPAGGPTLPPLLPMRRSEHD